MNGPITTEETYHVSNILKHYAHAKEKHPYFCDMLLPPSSEWTKENAHGYLNEFRNSITAQMQTHRLLWSELCNCEIAEAEDALINGDTAHAVEECYDAIAVLLRTVDVLKGWQKLGKPEKNNPPPRSARQRKIKKIHFPYCQPK